EGAGHAADELMPFIRKRMDLGSPYYAEHQRQAAESVIRGYNDAAGNLRAEMAHAGFGGAPSGASAAAFGELGAAQAHSLAEAFRKNLLNNESVQMQAAGMLPQVADIRLRAAGAKLGQAGAETDVGGLRTAQASGMGTLAQARLNQGAMKLNQA